MEARSHPQKFPDDSGPVGVYVHIPFCLSRCDYCGFVSYPFNETLEIPYIKALTEEIRNVSKSSAFLDQSFPKPLDTIYFGGGTPSVFKPSSFYSLLQVIRERFTCVDPVEITVEVNPGTYGESEFIELREAGINRISIGAQSLDDLELKRMKRLHSSADFMKALHEAQSAGFENVSVDLLAGYPGQTLKSVLKSLNYVIELGMVHVSVYLLEIKAGSSIEKLLQNGHVTCVDDDLVADMYEAICGELHSRGFNQYEISNFSRPGMESRHNLKYWADQVFVGFGLAAHGMTGQRRYSNIVDLDRYLSAAACKESTIGSLTAMDPLTRFKDAMIMGLRLTQGLDLGVMGSRYGFDAYKFVKNTLIDLDNSELYIMDGNTIKLTARGRLLSNVIFGRFV